MKDVELLWTWQRVIPSKEKVCMHAYKMCELHFDEKCILQTNEVMNDQIVYIYEWEKKTYFKRRICSDYFQILQNISHLKHLREKSLFP